jgi:hypothetical protein
MTEDLEILAMTGITRALDEIDDDAKRRVLMWASQRYNLSLPTQGQRPLADGSNGGSATRSYEGFVDLFDAAGPRTEAEKALVGGYWFQVVGESSDFQSQQVNDSLKDVGHGIGNITDALAKLQERKPALVRQVAKAGKSRQARKKYKLTSAGIRLVVKMIDGTEADE